jgi:RNA polymerase sigma-54 factor
MKLARSIVRNYIDDFASRRVLRVARRFRVVPALVETAFEMIAALTPFPAEGFQNSPGRPDREPAVSPDIIFRRNEQGWEVVVTGLDPNSVTLNRFYSSRLETLRENPSQAEGGERKHLTSYIQRARSFISSLEMRRETLTKVGRYLVTNQGAFLSTGDYAFLQPLTRAKLADQIGVHESTISRATSGKFVQLPNGELASFDVFFKASLRIQKMIAEILHTENPDNPLSDERISELLSARGIHIARRTVSKYRDRTKSLSSRKRRAA